MIEAFRDALRRLGHVEGKNLFLDLRIASLEDMPKHAAELAKSDLELVVASALPSALEIRRANPAMPMVIRANRDIRPKSVGWTVAYGREGRDRSTQ